MTGKASFCFYSLLFLLALIDNGSSFVPCGSFYTSRRQRTTGDCHAESLAGLGGQSKGKWRSLLELELTPSSSTDGSNREDTGRGNTQDGMKNQSSTSTNSDYKKKLAALDQAIADAEQARQAILQSELEKSSYQQQQQQQSPFSGTNLGSIDDQGNVMGNNDEAGLMSIDEWTPKELQRPPSPLPITRTSSSPQANASRQRQKQSSTTQPRSFTTRSKVSRSDAGTLVIDITPQGITSGVLFNGAFSVAWFSAIVPATLTALSGGLFGMALFMVPFWAAGGMVAKQAVVDPFVSSKLTLGEYAWSIEKQYGGSGSSGSSKNGPTIETKEGSTENLQGARVEVSAIVNDVPQFQLCLYSNKQGVVNLGLGLPEEELEKVAMEVNEYLEGLPSRSEGGGTTKSIMP